MSYTRKLLIVDIWHAGWFSSGFMFPGSALLLLGYLLMLVGVLVKHMPGLVYTIP